MCWITVYLRGRAGFEDAVLARLKSTWLLARSQADEQLMMFWLPKDGSLRNLKQAIGSKLIFQYRLHFVTNQDARLRRDIKPLAEMATRQPQRGEEWNILRAARNHQKNAAIAV